MLGGLPRQAQGPPSGCPSGPMRKPPPTKVCESGSFLLPPSAIAAGAAPTITTAAKMAMLALFNIVVSMAVPREQTTTAQAHPFRLTDIYKSARRSRGVNFADSRFALFDCTGRNPPARHVA